MRLAQRVAFILAILCCSLHLSAQVHPAITSWLINTTDIRGRHYIKGNATPIQDTFPANVQSVQYSAAYSYIKCSGIPAYVIGPYQDGNPALAAGRGYTFKIPLTPQVKTGAKTAVGLGHIAVLINGVPVYNYADARSYNNANVWHQNAIVFERLGFDCAKGHPSPVMGPPTGGQTIGSYHHHQDPSAFNIASVKMSDVCDMYLADGLYVPDSSKHGPLIGFSFDGYPIYGAYGWVDQNGTKVVKRMTPSYRMRAITDRTTLADGTVLTGTKIGPTLAQQPLGSYAEDFEYVAGSGDLDEHNGRFCITPEYPEGTYAYFATIDANGNSVYPYVIGPTYYGVVVTDNFAVPGPGNASTNVKITEPVTTYVPTTSTPTVQFTTQPVITASVAVAYTYAAHAQASVTAPITYRLLAAPTGMTIDSTTGVVSWSAPTKGTHTVSIKASIMQGGKEYAATQPYTLTVAYGANVSVSFTSEPVVKATVGTPYSYASHATASVQASLVYRLRTAPTGMRIDSTTGAITWATPVVGQYPVSVKASIVGDTISATQSFALDVAPEVTSDVTEDRQALSSITVFPNPASEHIIVQVTSPVTTSATVELIDLTGKVIQRADIRQGSTMCYLDVQTVYAGSYRVRVSMDGAVQAFNVVVQE